MLPPPLYADAKFDCTGLGASDKMRTIIALLCCQAGAVTSLRLDAATPGPRASRRAVVAQLAALAVLPVTAAEPEGPVACDDACMDARVRRKQELLRKQDRKAKADVKVLFGGDFQAGKRESGNGGAKLPVIGEFLLPADVGGVNLQAGTSAGGGGGGGGAR